MTADGKQPDPLPRRIRIKNQVVPMSYKGPDVTASTAAITAGVIQFQISGFSSKFTQWADLFDQFKVLQWSVTFNPPNPTIGVGTTNVNLGLLHTAIDFTDTNTPASAAELESYMTYRWNRHPRRLKREVKVQLGVPVDLTNGLFMFIGPRWMDCTPAGVDHTLNGVKYVQEQSVGITNGTTLYEVVISAILEFRQSK
jgi:hypothetical protein